MNRQTNSRRILSMLCNRTTIEGNAWKKLLTIWRHEQSAVIFLRLRCNLLYWPANQYSERFFSKNKANCHANRAAWCFLEVHKAFNVNFVFGWTSPLTALNYIEFLIFTNFYTNNKKICSSEVGKATGFRQVRFNPIGRGWELHGWSKLHNKRNQVPHYNGVICNPFYILFNFYSRKRGILCGKRGSYSTFGVNFPWKKRGILWKINCLNCLG